MVWGTGMIGATAAARFMAQLAENAKIPAAHGELPEVGHNQIVTFDGVLAGAGSSQRHISRSRRLKGMERQNSPLHFARQ